MQKPQAQAQSSAHEATTVRNLVNLKKHTLRLAPREGSPHILDISFNLDVVSPCRCGRAALPPVKWQFDACMLGQGSIPRAALQVAEAFVIIHMRLYMNIARGCSGQRLNVMSS